MSNELNFKPNSDRILVKLNEKLKTDSGLYIPESVQCDERVGVVVKVGEGRYVDGTWVEVKFSVGDKVLLDTIGGLNIKLNGVQYVLVRQEEILGRFE